MSLPAYLDHNATSPLRPTAFEAMTEALSQAEAARGRVQMPKLRPPVVPHGP